MAVVHPPGLKRAESPRCSICIANYNGEHLLADCIESILAQEFDHPVEIIVHDDASTDGSLDLLRARFPQVQVIASPTNVGFCIGNNRMVALSRAEFVLLLNNDAALLPGALAALHAAASGEPAILTLPQYDWETGALVDRGCLLDPFYNPVPNLDPARTDVAYVIGACLWIPRKTWHELGGFPEWMESIAEDIFLCCQARLHGIPVRVVAASGFRHRLGSSFGGARVVAQSLRTTMKRRALSERNKTYCMAVFTPAIALAALLPAHLALLLFEGVFLALVKRQPALLTRIYTTPLPSLVRNHEQLLRSRMSAMSGKRVPWRVFYRAFIWTPRKLSLLMRHGLPEVR